MGERRLIVCENRHNQRELSLRLPHQSLLFVLSEPHSSIKSHQPIHHLGTPGEGTQKSLCVDKTPLNSPLCDNSLSKSTQPETIHTVLE